MINPKQTKSKERIRDLGEVFTSEREVNAMLDLVRDESFKVESTFLEPTCGNGNFLVTILMRKLETIRSKYKKQEAVEYNIIKALSSIYGIDISAENIEEAHERMEVEVINFYSDYFNTNEATEGFWDSVRWILSKNIIIGDSLNKLEDITFVEYHFPKGYCVTRESFKLTDLIRAASKKMSFDFKEPVQKYKLSRYQELC